MKKYSIGDFILNTYDMIYLILSIGLVLMIIGATIVAFTEQNYIFGVAGILYTIAEVYMTYINLKRWNKK